MYYKLQIHSVDGETLYVIGTSDKAVALKFLEQYDHEGSSVSLEVFPSLALAARDVQGNLIEDGEAVYAELRG